jgi:mRNA-degrading endonuclease RelE of RelBE toxin-antitoxin system
MSFKIVPTDHFIREAKRLARKYPSVKEDLKILQKQLLEDPFKGTHLGKNVYKIRIAISSKGKGKSGGARVLTYLKGSSII